MPSSDSLANLFEAEWTSEADVDNFLNQHPEASPLDRLDVLLVDQSQRSRVNQVVTVEEYIERYPDLLANSGHRIALIVAEYRHSEERHAKELGDAPTLNSIRGRFPDVAAVAVELINGHDDSTSASQHDSLRTVEHQTEQSERDERGEHNPTATSDGLSEAPDITLDHGNLSIGAVDAREELEDIAEQIDRYEVLRLIGEGGFGGVYLARDTDLDRLVAIKVARRDRISTPEDIKQYLAEARIVANLDHNHIVPVYDFGRTDDGRCFVVSKFIEGHDLAEYLKSQRPTRRRIIDLLIEIARALDYAHSKGVIHRDIKPNNILVDGQGTAHLIDFGVALKQEHYGTGARVVGTPAYMSPEQARGEGHLVDCRSDVFGLGVVLYELTTGKRPFRAGSMHKVLEKVCHAEPKPPRSRDSSIPKELERICLKALSKRAADRYATSVEFADDLELYQAENDDTSPAAMVQSLDPSMATGAIKAGNVVQVVPKGLQSFDAEDADFFLALLPGSKDRDGLPLSIRFWKNRIEGRHAETTFRVGLIYGPSGCGKSSLIKAGLLPQLGHDVVSIYLEASETDTEERILNGLKRRLPNLREDVGLVSAMAAVREGTLLATDRKVVIFIDQFEQWLHAHAEGEGHELEDALRQCDGQHVQCVLMIRDDFWLGASRLMRNLEIELIEGRNMAMVDLFDKSHAKKVLAAFGRAFGKLPVDYSQLSKSEETFVDEVVDGLAEEGKVISVRLALFAEMIKSKPWTSQTLKDLGGTAGVGVTFLEETFTAANAPPEHRIYAEPARLVLSALLPEEGADIKGDMKSYRELRTACGYSARPTDFHRLLSILDNELRLISPTALGDHFSSSESIDSLSDDTFAKTSDTKIGDSLTRIGDTETSGTPGSQQASDNEFHVEQANDHEAGDADLTDEEEASEEDANRYYQLTHDYLVPSLRKWLTIKQQESAAGRAELALAERANLWGAKPEKTRLPSVVEWSSIGLLTDRRRWTYTQRRMMVDASKYYSNRAFLLFLVCFLVGWVVYGWNGVRRTTGLLEQLSTAEIGQVNGIIDDLEGYERWSMPRLTSLFADTDETSLRIRYALAQLPQDPQKVDFILQETARLKPGTLVVVAAELQGHREPKTLERLWKTLEQESADSRERFHAAMLLAQLDADGEYGKDGWLKQAVFLAGQLVDIDPVDYPAAIETLRPIRKHLFEPLHDDFVGDDSARRNMATSALVEYAADQPAVLANMLADASEQQFRRVFEVLEPHGDKAVKLLLAEIGTSPDDVTSDISLEEIAKRRANAAVGLARMDRVDDVWPLLRHDQNPRTRSHLVHRLAPLDGPASLFVGKFAAEVDVSTRRAVLLLLGEYPPESLSDADRRTALRFAKDAWSKDADPGMHAAARWLLLQWGERDYLKENKESLPADLAQIGSWYVGPGGHTMVNIDARGEANIDRVFEIASMEVSREQIEQFNSTHPFSVEYQPTVECPAGVVLWYEAVRYCQWLNEKADIPPEQWCYPPRNEITNKTPPMAADLSKGGFRLPTDEEWIFACQAGATTTRFYGDDDALMFNYGWVFGNSSNRTWPTGTLKPNDFGLFDMYGNVSEWRANIPSWNTAQVMIGGGAFSSQVNSRLVSTLTGSSAPDTDYANRGFRIARTYVVEPARD